MVAACIVIIMICKLGTKTLYSKILLIDWVAILICASIFACAGNGLTTLSPNTNKNNTFKIAEWNALDNLNSEAAKKIFIEYDVDIAVFPELGGYEKGDSSTEKIKDIFDVVGIDCNRYDVFTSLPTEGNIAPVTVVVKKSFASYTNNQKTPMTFYGTVYLESTSENLPDIIGLHTAPPLPGLMYIWQYDLDTIYKEIIAKNPGAIIVGDFNANLKHGAMSRIDTHDDALNYLSVFNRGTWPTNFPVPLRSSIDHIFLPQNKYGVKRIETFDLSASDHAIVLAEIYIV